MNDGIVVIGTGAHARKLWLYAKLLGLNVRSFLDEKPDARSFALDIPCVHPDLLTDTVNYQSFIVAIGNPATRREFQEKYQSHGWIPIVLVHPSAYVAEDVRIGAGSVICANAVVETGSVIGVGGIVDIGVSIDHDCVIGDYCHLKAGSILVPYSRVFN